MKRVNKNCDWFVWFGDECDWCWSDDITILLLTPLPKPPIEDDDDDEWAAAAAAANNNGFEVIVISRPELVVIDACWADELDRLEPPIAPFTAFDEDATGCGRRGNRSNCWRAA